MPQAVSASYCSYPNLHNTPMSIITALLTTDGEKEQSALYPIKIKQSIPKDMLLGICGILFSTAEHA